MNPQRLVHHPAAGPALLFVVALAVLRRTMVPTVYTLDSAELTVGAATLGLVHAPGYALYLLLAHTFTWLPLGDIAFRVNLFSAVCLALCAPLVYGLLHTLLADRGVAASAALAFVWSRDVWITGLFAEVYAPQLVTLAALGWGLAALCRRRQAGEAVTWRLAGGTGFLVGLAVTMVPSSGLMIPGVVVAFLVLRVPWQKCAGAAGISVVVFAVPLIYFPLRYASLPDYNLLGHYDAGGTFHPLNLTAIDNLIGLLQGRQFAPLFFADGLLPIHSFGQVAGWLWDSSLGIGLLLAVIGAGWLWRAQRGVLAVWLAFFLPYTYFYAAYGAPDRRMMLGPARLAVTVVMAYGLRWALAAVRQRPRRLALALLPAVFLAVNFRLVDLSHERSMRQFAGAVLADAPPNAHIFGVWWEIVPLDYLHYIEHQRPDVTLYNLFLFDERDIRLFVEAHVDPTNPLAQHPVIVLSAAQERLNAPGYLFAPLDTHEALLALTRGQIGAHRLVGIYHPEAPP